MLNTVHIDWRRTAVLLLVAALFAQWNTLGAALVIGVTAYLLLRAGSRAWRGGPLPIRRGKETYWRGRRIDLEPRAGEMWSMAARPSLQSLLYLLLGTGLAVTAIGMLLNVMARR